MSTGRASAIGDLPRTLFIAGPTASGKTRLAAELAARLGGVVINADSMQVYRDLHVLTARPTPDEELRAPHLLYGVLEAEEACSAGRWRTLAIEAIAATHRDGRHAVLVGGTGLYIRTLTHGLSQVPEPGAAARARARADVMARGLEWAHAQAVRLDPEAARAVHPHDAQRIERILAVAYGAREPLSAYRSRSATAAQPWLAPGTWAGLVLAPNRAWLHQRIAARADAMLDGGAVAEAAALAARTLSPDLPILRALGVSELARLAAGEITRAEARERLIVQTRQYAKRQETWFRGQMGSWPRLTEREAGDPDLDAAMAATVARLAAFGR